MVKGSSVQGEQLGMRRQNFIFIELKRVSLWRLPVSNMLCAPAVGGYANGGELHLCL